MNSRSLIAALMALAWSAGFGVVGVTPARAAADSTRFLRDAHQVLEPGALGLGRAALERGADAVRGVVENLEGIDFSTQPPFAEADRAAFLLGEAYLEQGDVTRFTSLARSVSRWGHDSVYTRWLAFELQLIEAGGGGGARVSPGDSLAGLTALSTADTITALGRDLAGAALIRLATRALAANEDARGLLARVPAGSRYASRARHMLGLLLLERGETGPGAAALASLLADDSTYGARRDVMLALAGQALDSGRWESAHQTYRAIDGDWGRVHRSLERLLSAGSVEELWSAWEAHPDLSGMVTLDARPARLLAEQLAIASVDLRARPVMGVPPLDEPAPAPAPSWPVAPPGAEAWSAVAASANRLAQATAELGRTRWAVTRERDALADRRRYLEIGRGRAGGEEGELLTRKALLDSLRRTLVALDARLRSVRDAERAHVAERTTGIIEACARSLLWMRAMRHFSIEGPDSSRVVAHPAGLPGPDSLLAGEEALTRAVQACAERIAAETPGRLARSYAEAWRPGLIDRAAAEGVGAGAALAWARSIGASIDSGLADANSSETLRRLEARLAALAVRTDSLRMADDALRARVAREAIRRALAALDDERESIDYGLAVSAYGMSVRLGARESLGTRVAAVRGPAARLDTLGAPHAPGEEPADAEAARWRGEAIPLLTSFLARHPRSFARAEMRFRLADLELTDDLEAFRARMAEFTRRQAAGQASGLAVPVLSHAGALALYRSILDEDRAFEHRDAVLFNAGMILADEADPGAAGYFSALVAEHPESPYVQEAYLRMGDMEFDQKRFPASVALYEHAGAGADPTLRTIAFYKMGWAHFSEDRFLEAADAFRRVLDLYASGERAAIQVDIEDEAEAYLVHSIAGAGGATAFAGYFDRIGPRPYERRILMALGQHYRRYGEFLDAVAADQLWLRRYPTDADALIIAQRMVETHARSNHPALEREARLTLAPRFAPGGEWSTAQASDSARAEGAAFARSSWLSVALEHHRRARASGSAADWREAARLYELVIAHWPRDPETPALELGAGEAGAQLGDYATALRHYGEAARTGPDSIASIAMWQRVAVTDAWYERTRPGGARGGTAPGNDSLAHAVIDAGDQLLARFPEHARGADIVWRQSQLGLAHGWRERAVQDLARMTARYPDDARAPVAASQRGDALYRLGDFAAAGAAFEEALVAARRVGRDSLARVAARAIPVCYYRDAVSAAAADTTADARNAERFERFATRFPEYEHAHVAQYRAGLAWARAGRPREAVRVMQALLQRFPASEYARDARLQLAKSWEAVGDREQAALAYVEFAQHHPDDESAGPAYLKAADLDAAAGQADKADELRLTYIRKYPDDVETAMTILEGMARRELAGLGPGQPISTLLGKTVARHKGAPPAPAPASRLADYMRRAAAHPTLAARDLVAQVRFLQGEEASVAYAAARLRQPLTTSIPAKKRLLDTLLVRYRRTVDLGVSDWAHAAAFRIGSALVEFGDALEHSERPADLRGDDLSAYEDVLAGQAQAFNERGEAVWSDLLRQSARKGPDDAWTTQAQSALWQRLSSRFLYRPETEFPLVRATAPARDREEPRRAQGTKDSLSVGARALARGERAE